MTYTGATQTERVTAGSTNFTYNVLGCAGANTGVGSNTPYTRDNKGQLVEERLPGMPSYVPYYYLFDGMGSVVGLTDASGNVANTYSYEPYGKLASSTGSVANPWLFASGYLDSSTGLYKFGMRYYDPSIARWTEEDSQTGPNLYAYVGGNPTNNVDPTGGYCGWWLIPTLLFGIATAIAVTQPELVVFTPYLIDITAFSFVEGFFTSCPDFQIGGNGPPPSFF